MVSVAPIVNTVENIGLGSDASQATEVPLIAGRPPTVPDISQPTGWIRPTEIDRSAELFMLRGYFGILPLPLRALFAGLEMVRRIIVRTATRFSRSPLTPEWGIPDGRGLTVAQWLVSWRLWA